MCRKSAPKDNDNLSGQPLRAPPWRESQPRVGSPTPGSCSTRTRKSYDCRAVVLFSLVATHADIDLETVAQLSTGASGLATSALAGSPAVAGAVVLATCNRFEIYGEAPHPDDVEAARAALVSEISGASGLNEQLVSRSFNTRTGPDVSRHLFAVSSGLDSAVVGEREIAGQVRRALITAQHEGTASSGRRQESSIATPSRTVRYSGRERPAWRMNQTGRREGVPPR